MLWFQVGNAIRDSFPSVLGDLSFRMAWAFKYDHETGNDRGIDTHSDKGRVSVNLWVTEDAANLDPESGGLVLYDKAPPDDWAFHAYNQNTSRIMEYLGSDPPFARVPHRQNRALLFLGRRFHRTDRIVFRKGYRYRRINVTFLYD
jgi:hypothetical protein